MKPEIMIVGSQHYHELFSNKEPDESFLDYLDILRDELLEFQPTRVCIEQEAKIQDTINTYFKNYNADTFYKNEAYDLGFFISKKLKLNSVTAMDWMEASDDSNGISNSHEWAKANNHQFIKTLEEIQTLHTNISELNDPFDMTVQLNKPENYRKDQVLYGQMMLLGDDWKTSIPWLSWWYKRNMIMVNNITKNLAPDDKVIVIVGSDHIYILKQLLEASESFDVFTFYEWLEKQ